jgi:hypothetical protein
MKEYVARHSQEEGLEQSRLPEFDAAWVAYIKGAHRKKKLTKFTKP